MKKKIFAVFAIALMTVTLDFSAGAQEVASSTLTSFDPSEAPPQGNRICRWHVDTGMCTYGHAISLRARCYNEALGCR